MPSPLYVQLKPKIDAAINHYINVSNQKLRVVPLSEHIATTIPDVNWLEILTKFVATVAQIIEKESAASNASDKRQVAIDAAIAFWQQTGKQWAAAAFGQPFIFNNFVEPMLEKEIPVVVGGIYDGIISVFDRFTNPPTTATPTEQGPGAGPSGFTPY